jgi:hypothetical protein
MESFLIRVIGRVALCIAAALIGHHPRAEETKPATSAPVSIPAARVGQTSVSALLVSPSSLSDPRIDPLLKNSDAAGHIAEHRLRIQQLAEENRRQQDVRYRKFLENKGVSVSAQTAVTSTVLQTSATIPAR